MGLMQMARALEHLCVVAELPVLDCRAPVGEGAGALATGGDEAI